MKPQEQLQYLQDHADRLSTKAYKRAVRILTYTRRHDEAMQTGNIFQSLVVALRVYHVLYEVYSCSFYAGPDGIEIPDPETMSLGQLRDELADRIKTARRAMIHSIKNRIASKISFVMRDPKDLGAFIRLRSIQTVENYGWNECSDARYDVPDLALVNGPFAPTMLAELLDTVQGYHSLVNAMQDAAKMQAAMDILQSELNLSRDAIKYYLEKETCHAA